MKNHILHRWDLSPSEAVRIQEALKGKIRLRFPKIFPQRIAAGDVAYDRSGAILYGAFLSFTYPDLMLLERSWAQRKVTFPYIPGLLTFREAPVLLQAFYRLTSLPDVILLDGQGIAHPRRLGIAAHLGLLLNRPSIGCGKSRLVGHHENPGEAPGSFVPLMDGEETIGAVVRTRGGVKPIYISPGHKMDVEHSVRLILSLCRGYRIPEPLRQAHIFVNSLKSLKIERKLPPRSSRP